MFKRGDKIKWTDLIVGFAEGVVTSCEYSPAWRDTEIRVRITKQTIFDRKSDGSEYPVFPRDNPQRIVRVVALKNRSRVDAGPKTL